MSLISSLFERRSDKAGADKRLRRAVLGLNVKEIRKALKLGANPNLADELESIHPTPLITSIFLTTSGEMTRQMECAQLLFDAGADIDGVCETNNMSVPGMMTFVTDPTKKPVVDWFLSRGADLNFRDVSGMTALHRLIRRMKLDKENHSQWKWNAILESPETSVVESLLSAGADPFALDQLGKSVVQVAEEAGFEDLRAYIESYRDNKESEANESALLSINPTATTSQSSFGGSPGV